MPLMIKLSSIALVSLLVLLPKTPVQAQTVSQILLNNETKTTIQLPTQISTITPELTLTAPALQLKSITVTSPRVAQIETPTKTTPVPALKEIARQMVEEKFGKGQFEAFDYIIFHESGWNPNAINESSGACGLGQALPCSKITDHSDLGQLNWTIDYIRDRYINPVQAQAFWLAHNWY